MTEEIDKSVVESLLIKNVVKKYEELVPYIEAFCKNYGRTLECYKACFDKRVEFVDTFVGRRSSLKDIALNMSDEEKNRFKKGFNGVGSYKARRVYNLMVGEEYASKKFKHTLDDYVKKITHDLKEFNGTWARGLASLERHSLLFESEIFGLNSGSVRDLYDDFDAYMREKFLKGVEVDRSVEISVAVLKSSMRKGWITDKLRDLITSIRLVDAFYSSDNFEYVNGVELEDVPYTFADDVVAYGDLNKYVEDGESALMRCEEVIYKFLVSELKND